MILIIPVVSGLMWNCLAEGATRRPTQLNANIRYETATLLSLVSAFLDLADPVEADDLIRYRG